ncbi:putative fatty acyl-CoA reductase CG5065 isoform X1 [Neodiprion fabricii]|uniref:putative fatty acyl-CoA reductase CG5065 isoform X1 n=1 Tax=Neodiprion fabricii TaxID=2872261 RepID=UPI001ED90336|nr:putative fatty acyl-CoA reductase CG5065 isoform X1 [Neodiprion fabricii]XP_046422620.1 putative fatty acyl-CoA reductase CG5065 isoform X1 [Neodiprion fabricii]
MDLDPTTSIPAFYAGRSIFITGGTGFMGKVLIEKLLRSCPAVEEIFLLMRPKKNSTIDARLKEMLTSPLYDKLKKTNPSAFKKLIPVAGDVAEEGLGLPPVERRVLIEKVSIVFHVAANVRFDDPLKHAVLMNTRGTREVCILAASMKKLVVLLHVSTTYGNTDRPVVEEVLYPAHTDWKKAIKIVENTDENILNIMTPKFLGKLPNTYTFTKQLAEHVINEYAGIIPCVIFRPSVVVATLEEPMPGWMDNFNGPVGLMIGGGKGVLKSVYGNPDLIVDFIPVDVAIKSLLVSAWQRGITPITRDPSVPVYNCSSNGIRAVTTKAMINLALEIVAEIPLEGCLWVPNTTMYSNIFIYYLTVWIFHFIPAVIIDTVLKISGAKPRLLRLHRKIYTANFALTHFLKEKFTFEHAKLLGLNDMVPQSDRADFNVDIGKFGIRDYFIKCLIGSKMYLLKEDMNKVAEAKAHYDKMWWIDRVLKVWLAIFITWLGFTCGIFAYISTSVISLFDFSLVA